MIKGTKTRPVVSGAAREKIIEKLLSPQAFEAKGTLRITLDYIDRGKKSIDNSTYANITLSVADTETGETLTLIGNYSLRAGDSILIHDIEKLFTITLK